VELLLDRHLAEQGRVKLLEKRRPYTGEIQHLTREDPPALIEADQLRVEEGYHQGRVEAVREVQEDLEQFFIAGLAEAAREAWR
jgi:hypothetical protein